MVNNKKIYILCDHGLGNRIGSLIGGLTFAKRTNATPVICWPINNWCKADFNDIFDSNLTVESNEFSAELVDQIQDLGLHYFFVSTYNNKISTELINFEDIMSTNQDIIYSQCKVPKRIVDQTDIGNALDSLGISNSVLDKVKKFCNEHLIDKRTTGIHLRKTDGSSIANEDEIFEEIKKFRNQKYFICSDNKETENRFLQLPNVSVYLKNSEVVKLTDGDWRDSVINSSGKKILFNVDRSKEQIYDAFIDMLILSRTTVSKRAKSTFCTVAKYYSSVPIFKGQ